MLSFNYFLHKIKQVTHPDNNNTIMLPTLISHMPKQRANVKTDQRILDAPSNHSLGRTIIHQSIQSFHDGPPLWWCFGWVCVCVHKRVGWVSHFLPTQDFVIQFSRAPSFGCKRGNPNYEFNLHWDDPKETSLYC